MNWHPDLPDIPIKKPKEIEILESMDRVSLDSMPPLEVYAKVDEIAHSVARDYKDQMPNGSFEECAEIVSIVLENTGSAIGGHVGNAMISACNSAALKASQNAFPPAKHEF
ncbi:MAG TPA: hypothetical protein VGP47_08940 [Parachlamydiaceae bacterium]|nr:hypothetical protein [Parachlamydiaceae bacterium]